jgi:hypothetical protein
MGDVMATLQQLAEQIRTEANGFQEHLAEFRTIVERLGASQKNSIMDTQSEERGAFGWLKDADEKARQAVSMAKESLKSFEKAFEDLKDSNSYRDLV